MKHDRTWIGALGRKIFPGDAPWQRRKKVRFLLLAILAGLIIGGFIIGMSWMQIYQR
jgi:hypothetical protein